jgi:hypothetical protein
MRYISILIILFLSVLSADTFDENCRTCHKQERQLQMFMARYTLKYSNEEDVKKAIYKYLKNPDSKNSIMPFGFINRWGVKEKSDLDDKRLKEAINLYYKKYNLINLLK